MTIFHNNVVVASALLGGVAAINNGLAITPPMGWVKYLM
jgi:hypothetical protein